MSSSIFKLFLVVVLLSYMIVMSLHGLHVPRIIGSLMA